MKSISLSFPILNPFSYQVSLLSKCILKYLALLACGILQLLILTGGYVCLDDVKMTCVDLDSLAATRYSSNQSWILLSLI